METGLGLELKLSQKLKLTPNLALSLELLQLPLPQLEEILKNEIEENPLIEPLDFIYESSATYYEPSESEESNPAPAPVSPRQRLEEQINLEFESPEREVALFILNNLDSRGLFTIPVKEVLEKFEIEENLFHSIRERLKSLEPAGCGSLTVEELIEAQLREMEAPEKLLSAVKRLELLKTPERLKREVGLTEEEVEKLFSLLRHVDLSPLEEGHSGVRVKPDAAVWLEGEEVKVEVPLPKWLKFKINSHYLKHAEGEELRRYINEKYQRALYLKRAVDNRRQTLERLTRAIFNHQKAFLKDGKSLKPLSISEVAREIELHESTVSRAVKEKFVETPFGIYPLKFFFKKGVSGTAVDSVKEMIRELIEKEDRKRPLSDSKIASLLKERGIKVARRTVAKYREELGIPGAYQRRER
jgi:RNA polymerase sigma-54 factor